MAYLIPNRKEDGKVKAVFWVERWGDSNEGSGGGFDFEDLGVVDAVCLALKLGM